MIKEVTKRESFLSSLTLILFAAALIAAAIFATKEAAELNHEEPERPDYRIETERGLEYPKY